MTKALGTEIEPVPALLYQGKDEMNFAEHPIALLTDRVPKGQTSIKFEDEVWCDREKKLVARKRLIEGSQEYGLPTATDDKVILALIQLTKQKNDFTRREVEFSRLELIRLLGWTNEGKNYDRIKLSLLRVKGVDYIYDNAWWDPRQKRWTTKAFSIIDNVSINDSRASDGQGGLFPSHITWNKVVFESFQAGFVRDIDFQLCMRLEHAISLRIYRFLGKRFYLKSDLTFDLKEFAEMYLNLGRNYEGGAQIARKLKPAIAELEDVGFLEPLTESERFPKKGRNWQVRFVKKAATIELTSAGDTQDDAKAADQTEDEPARLTAALISRGVGKTKAATMAKKHSPEEIRAKIEEFDWLVTTPDKPKKPAGYLVKSIEDGYGTPPEYLSLDALREKQKAEAIQARQVAEGRRRKQAEEDRERAERKAIEAHWESLSKEDQAQLDAAAQAEAEPESLKLIEPGPLRKYGIKSIRDRYIVKLLRSQGKLPDIDTQISPANGPQDVEPPFRLGN